MSFLGYGATGHPRNESSSSKQPSLETMRVLTVAPSVEAPLSNTNTNRGREEYPQGNTPEAIISADGLIPSDSGVRNRNSGGAGVDEKTTLLNNSNNNQQYYQPNDGHHAHDHDDHRHRHECFHAPGEHCSLPHSIQPLISPMNHAVVENVVIKVMDGADVTQKIDNPLICINVLGVVIGGAFSDIIDSVVADILTPPLSLWAAGTNLENSFIVLRHGRTPNKIYATYLEAQADGAV
ncbi:hypothetical protein BGZ76_011605 [Entomortierella beljakovae]|nr:hypothetical protein BGZ76_011605 [Entomortierella beljakovae]